MNAAYRLLDDLAVIGATIGAAGGRLILRAGATEIPAALVSRIREAKGELIAFLPAQTDHGGVDVDDDRHHNEYYRTFEDCVVQWLDHHPTPTEPGRCGFCGGTDTHGATVLPFGTEPETHTWLHAECWPDWHQGRRAEAIASLAAVRPTTSETNSPRGTNELGSADDNPMQRGNAPTSAELFAPEPMSESVEQPAEAEPGLDEPWAARRGRVQKLDGLLLHFCVACGRFGTFGYGVRLHAGQLGRWYCRRHRPQEGDEARP